MAHTYQSVTKSDNTYTAVSPVRPVGTVEDKFTWDAINTNYDTWLELLMKAHWCDWYYGTPYTDNYTSLTRADRTYQGITV